MKSFTFIHAADIHLDSPLKGFVPPPSAGRDSLRNSTREAFERLVDFTIREPVDLLLIAGDLYDGDWRDYRTGLFFVKQMGRLREAGVPVYLVYGNHDAQSQITKSLELPDNVHSFATGKSHTLEIETLDLALHGQGYATRHLTDNLAQHYPPPRPGAFNLGLLHTGLGGLGGHENYAPCTLEELKNKGYDYWALGHVHQPAVLHENPHIVFSGNLQGRHVRETGPRGAYRVRVDEGLIADFSFFDCDVVRWHAIRVPVTECGDFGELTDRLRQAIEEALKEEPTDRLAILRIVLEGRTEQHEQLLAAQDRLQAEARAAALQLGNEVAWIEKVVLATQPPADRLTGELVDDIQRILSFAPEDSGLLERLDQDVGKLMRQLPSDLTGNVEDPICRAALDRDYPELIRQAIPHLTAQLTDFNELP